MRINPKIPEAENSEMKRDNDSQPVAATVPELISQLSQVPEVRQARVDSLRSEIQSGQFQRSNDQIAGAIVSQLLGGNIDG